MTTKNKTVYGVVGTVVLVALFFIGKLFGGATYVTNLPGTVSSVGSSFGTAKVAQINLSPTIAATTTGILNTDSSDRIIESTYYYCEGVGTSQTGYVGTGLAALTLTVGTSTSQTPASITNINAFVTTVSTSTINSYAASTTAQTYWRVWATGTYLNFGFNATNTASCTVGTHYLAS